jgi:hypothetical protein
LPAHRAPYRPHFGGELVEEPDVIAHLDRSRLRARQRVPARQRGLGVEELLHLLVALEDQVVGIEEERLRVRRPL